MLRPCQALVVERVFRLLAVCLAFVFGFPVGASAEEAARRLQLEVSINGHPTHLIAAFTDVAGQGLSTTRGELAELRIRALGTGQPDDVVRLSSITGMTYELDESAQKLNLIADDTLRIAKTYSASSAGAAPTAGKADYGLVANYNVFSSATQGLRSTYAPAFAGTNVALDGRFITPFGVLNQTGIVGPNLTGNTDTLRLDTYAVRVDPETLHTYRAGDLVSGALGWTHPIRMGGAQVQHDYTFRSDLVTASLPSVSGSAAVPSTVDVYINNVKSVTQQVGAGPFQISNLPAYAGGGDARVVVRDASGKETQTSLSFFASPRLLREGVYESSLEIGAPRLRYGTVADDYAAQTVGSGTLRMGLLDWLTLEAHSEGGMGLMNGGAGVVARAGSLGVVTAAASGSTGQGRRGAQLYGAFDTMIGPASLHVSSQRALGGYDDLAAATARLRPSFSGAAGYTGTLLATQQARSLDGVSFSVPLEFDRSSIGASFLQAVTDDGQRSRIATVTYARPLFVDANFYATAFRDFADAKGSGVYVGVTMPLGKTRAAPLVGQNATATVSLQNSAQGHQLVSDVSSSSDNSVGAWGWRVRDSEGSQSYRDAGVSHRTAIARLDANVRQDGETLTGRFQADEAVVAMGGNVYFANRIDDSFGVVSAGTAGVKVTQDNRIVGETDENGKLLVPNLRSHGVNRISIDPSNLPLDAEVDRTSQAVTPAFRSGVYVDFSVKTSVQAAIVILKTADGVFVPAGSEAVLADDASPHVVGYDGQVYLNKLHDRNTVTVKRADNSTCTAAFSFVAKRGEQSVVGPITCQ